MVTTARVDAVIEQHLTIGLEGHPPDQAIEGARVTIQPPAFRALAEPELVVKLQQILSAKVGPAGPAVTDGLLGVDHRPMRVIQLHTARRIPTLCVSHGKHRAVVLQECLPLLCIRQGNLQRIRGQRLRRHWGRCSCWRRILPSGLRRRGSETSGHILVIVVDGTRRQPGR